MPIKIAKQVRNQTSHGEKGKHDSLNTAAFLKVSKKRETVETQRALKQSPALEPADVIHGITGPGFWEGLGSCE